MWSGVHPSSRDERCRVLLSLRFPPTFVVYPVHIPIPFPIPLPLPRPPTLRFRAQKLLQEAATTRQSTPVQERSIAWNRLKEETDLKRIVSGARKW